MFPIGPSTEPFPSRARQSGSKSAMPLTIGERDSVVPHAVVVLYSVSPKHARQVASNVRELANLPEWHRCRRTRICSSNVYHVTAPVVVHLNRIRWLYDGD